jgi:hypothetical protein
MYRKKYTYYKYGTFLLKVKQSHVVLHGRERDNCNDFLHKQSQLNLKPYNF